MRPVLATLTRCRDNNPLIVLDSEPFNGLEISPDDLRRFAQRLIHLADLAACLPTDGQHYRPTKIEMGDEANHKETERE